LEQQQQQQQQQQHSNEIFSTPTRSNATAPLGYGFRGEEPLRFQSPYNQEQEDENATPTLGFRIEQEPSHLQNHPYNQEEEEANNHDVTLRRSLPSFSTVSSRQGLFQNEDDDDSYAFMLGGEVVLHRHSSNDHNNNLANGSPSASMDQSSHESNRIDNSNSTDESSPPMIAPMPSRPGDVPPCETTVAISTSYMDDRIPQPPSTTTTTTTPQPWIVPRSASDYSQESSGLQAILEVHLTPRNSTPTADASPRQAPPRVPDFTSPRSR
jgi:hypothetical protein